MLQGKIYKILKEKIGEYLYGFKEDQLDIGIFSGRIKLENVTLKHDKINENPALQRSPIAIKAGMLGLLQVDVKYTDLGSVDILIEDIFLVVGPNFSHLRKREDYKNNEERFLELSKKLEKSGEGPRGAQPMDISKSVQEGVNIKHILDPKKEVEEIYQKKLRGEKVEDPDKTKEEIYDMNKPPKTNESNPLIKVLLNSEFLKNQRVVINRIHIRYEDDQITYKDPIAMGFMISSIQIGPNEEIEIGIPVQPETPHFGYYQTEKKLVDGLIQDILEHPNGRAVSYHVTISGIESYITLKSEMYIPYSLYENTMYSPNGIFEAMPPLELKGLMLTYFQSSKHHKHPLLKIEQIKIQMLIAIRQDISKNWRQYVLLKAAINNLAVDFKPDILQDALDLAHFYQNFKGRLLLHRFRPEIRPILDKKIYSVSPQTEILKKEITREWWRLILWLNRLKKAQGKEEIIEKMYAEFQNSSYLNKLADFKPENKVISLEEKASNGKDIVSHSVIKQADLETSKDIFRDVPPKQDLPQREDQNYLRFKLPYLYAFVEIKNITINLRKPNHKTFLNIRLEYIHLNALANIEFEKNHSMTFHMSSFRIFYYYNDTPKQIFAGNPKQSGRDSEYPSRDQSMIQDFGARNTLNNSALKGQGVGKGQSQVVSVNNLADRSQRVDTSKIERPTTQSQIKTKITATNLNTDIVILELKDSIILKLNFKVLEGSARSLQLRTELGEFEIKVENAVVKDVFEYMNDLRRNHTVRHMILSMDFRKNLKSTQLNMEKHVILTDSPDKTNLLYQDSPQRMILDPSGEHSMLNQKQSPDRSNIFNMSKADSPYMEIFRNKFQSYLSGAQTKTVETVVGDLISPDPMNLLMKKLTHFFQSNEILVSVNVNGVHVVISESAPQTVEKTELLSVTVPKGKIFLSLNYNRKSLNLVDVYGFKVETSSRFQAIYSFVKKMKNIIKMGIEFNRDPNSKFYELLKKKKDLTEEELEFRKLYAAYTEIENPKK